MPRRSVTALSDDQELALIHVPARLREPFRALFEIDAAMGDVVARSTDPALGRIKLAWWREQLEALDTREPPAEPRLTAVAEHLLGKGVAGTELARLEAGWATLLDADVHAKLVAERGAQLFEVGGRLLGSKDARLAEAGALYSLSSVARRGLPELFDHAREMLKRVRGHRFERQARPMTMLARAAIHEGSERGRAFAMLAHRWSGRIG